MSTYSTDDAVYSRLHYPRRAPDLGFEPPEFLTGAAPCTQVDPETFFPEKRASNRAAKAICAGCEFRTECLEYALANHEHWGIFGGLTERERRRLTRGAA